MSNVSAMDTGGGERRERGVREEGYNAGKQKNNHNNNHHHHQQQPPSYPARSFALVWKTRDVSWLILSIY